MCCSSPDITNGDEAIPPHIPLSREEMEAFRACAMLDTHAATNAADLLATSDLLIREATRSLAMAPLMSAHLPLLPRAQGSSSWSVSEYLFSVTAGGPIPMSLSALTRRINHLTLHFTKERPNQPDASAVAASVEAFAPEWWDTEGYVHTYHGIIDAPPFLVDYSRKVRTSHHAHSLVGWLGGACAKPCTRPAKRYSCCPLTPRMAMLSHQVPIFTLSKFPLDVWAGYFRDQCKECRHFYTSAGSIKAGLATNHTNACHHADILSWLAGEWRLPLIAEPPPGRLPNHASLLWSPTSVAPEVTRMREWGVLCPGQPLLVHPTMAVIRDGELAEALRLLRGMGRRCPYSHKRDIDHINRHIEEVLANPPLDHPQQVALLKKVRLRLCLDTSKLLNPYLAHWPFSYCTVSDAIALLEGWWMAKIDLEKYFNQILLNISDWKYMGANLDDLQACLATLKAYEAQGIDVKEAIDLVSAYAQFGVASFPALANALMAATSSILRHLGIPNCFLTDDVFICGPTQAACQAALDKAVTVMRQLGWRLQNDKITPPAQQMVFLGIMIYTIRCRLSLPEAKVAQYLQTVINALEDAANGCLRYKDLESLVGKLNWIAEVVIAGRARVRRISSCLWMDKSQRRTYSKAQLSAGAMEDLRWWKEYLSDTSAADRWVPFWTTQPPIHTSTFSDASGDIGYSLVLDGTVYQGLWNEDVPPSSGFKELIPLLLAVQQLGDSAHGRIVILTTDNVGNVFAINKGSCKSDQSYRLLARISEIAAEKQIYLVADWVPRDFNSFSDAVSRYPWMCHA